MASLKPKQAYLKRLRAERNKIAVISPKKRTAWQRSRMKDLQRAIKIVDIEIGRLKKPAKPEKPIVEGLITNKQIKALTETFKKMGVTASGSIADAVKNYTARWQSYQQDKSYYAANWQKMYGTELPEFGFENNPFAMAAAIGSGTYLGYNLADLAKQANLLKENVAEYTKLGAGDWEGVESMGYREFQEASGGLGVPSLSAQQIAQMKTGTISGVEGTAWESYRQRYEDFRKRRQAGFKPEKTAYSFPQRKPELTADYEY